MLTTASTATVDTFVCTYETFLPSLNYHDNCSTIVYLDTYIYKLVFVSEFNGPIFYCNAAAAIQLFGVRVTQVVTRRNKYRLCIASNHCAQILFCHVQPTSPQLSRHTRYG